MLASTRHLPEFLMPTAYLLQAIGPPNSKHMLHSTSTHTMPCINSTTHKRPVGGFSYSPSQPPSFSRPKRASFYTKAVCSRAAPGAAGVQSTLVSSRCAAAHRRRMTPGHPRLDSVCVRAAAETATAAEQPPTPPASTPSPPTKEIPTYAHLVIPPPTRPSPESGTRAVTTTTTTSTSDAVTDCLLVVAPGAFLPLEAFRPLAAAVQAAAPALRLWSVVVNVDYPSLMAALCPPGATFKDLAQAMKDADVCAQLVRQALAQAEQQGFVARREGPARVGNMALLCQSAGTFGFVDVGVRAAAATVLLAGAPNTPDHMRRQVVSLEAWPRPLMLLLGELDGQMRWPFMAPYLAETAAMAAKFGPGFTARSKPVVVVSGVNHGNTSNGDVRTARGDIGLDRGVVGHGTAMRLLGGHVAAFLTTHIAASEQARQGADEALLAAVRDSMRLTAPYCKVLGLGDPGAPFAPLASEPPLPAGAAWAAGAVSPGAAGAAAPWEAGPGAGRVGGLVAGAQRSAGQAMSNALPPGEVLAAEAHTAALQRRVLAGLPPGAADRVAVAATAHTDVETFLYSQPVMSPLGAAGGGRWLLHVHVLLHFKSLDSDPSLQPHLLPHAADYCVKLKSAQMVAAVLGLPNPTQYSTPLPAYLNAFTLDLALAAAPAAVVDRYRTRGRRMEFADDRDALGPGPDGQRTGSPEAFVRSSRITYHFPPPPPPTTATPTAASAPAAEPTTATPTAASAPAAEPTTAGPPVAPPAQPSDLGVVRVSSPYVLVPPPEDVASRPAAEARFMGPFYTRLLSVAQAMEWVWLDCLREIGSPW